MRFKLNSKFLPTVDPAQYSQFARIPFSPHGVIYAGQVSLKTKKGI